MHSSLISRSDPAAVSQVALYLKTPLAVKCGDTVSGMIGFTRGLEYKRAYDMSVTYQLGEAAPLTALWQLE